MNIGQVLIDIADFLGGLFDLISSFLYWPVDIGDTHTNVLNIIFVVGIPVLVFVLILKALIK